MRPESVLGSGLASPRLRRSLLSNRWLLRREREKPAARCPRPSCHLTHKLSVITFEFRVTLLQHFGFLSSNYEICLLHFGSALPVSALEASAGSSSRCRLPFDEHILDISRRFSVETDNRTILTSTGLGT